MFVKLVQHFVLSCHSYFIVPLLAGIIRHNVDVEYSFHLVSALYQNLLRSLVLNRYEPRHEKSCLMSYANNNGADQLAHPRSLISVFVVHCLHSIVPSGAKSIIQNSSLSL